MLEWSNRTDEFDYSFILLFSSADIYYVSGHQT